IRLITLQNVTITNNMSGNHKRTGGKPSSITKITWAHATRDIVNRAMSTGQMLPLCVFVVLVILLTRVPNEKIPDVIHDILVSLLNWNMLGWIFFVLALIAWAGHARIMRKDFSSEAERIGKEKTTLQQQKTSQPLGTSDQ
ncbi:TPA: hypothetical protein M5839_004823, partial [Citrobacter freundii]|nr:hypothetical protein [Citrobacter freundii]